MEVAAKSMAQTVQRARLRGTEKLRLSLERVMVFAAFST
jgi:hypothetical protein